MRGKTVVITGATSGIGLAAAETLAREGARVVFTARDPAKAREILGRLAAANPNAEPDWVQADLTTIAAMKAAGAALASRAPGIDVLINNAGALFDHREVTADGLEKTFAVNHMAYFVVTASLRAALSPGARIVSTASIAHSFARLDFDDLQSARRYSAFGAYGLSKLCNILWTQELSRRLEGTGITATCFHPGGVNTNFAGDARGLIGAVMGLGKRFMLTPAQGADTLIFLASSPDVAGRTGGYWTKRRLVQPSAAARDPLAARRLWEISAQLSGYPPGSDRGAATDSIMTL
jgi:NAD(P)-dependent dehydrogenase (short-subunit alcohol dehydrogenase family)